MPCLHQSQLTSRFFSVDDANSNLQRFCAFETISCWSKHAHSLDEHASSHRIYLSIHAQFQSRPLRGDIEQLLLEWDRYVRRLNVAGLKFVQGEKLPALTRACSPFQADAAWNSLSDPLFPRNFRRLVLGLIDVDPWK